VSDQQISDETIEGTPSTPVLTDETGSEGHDASPSTVDADEGLDATGGAVEAEDDQADPVVTPDEDGVVEVDAPAPAEIVETFLEQPVDGGDVPNVEVATTEEAEPEVAATEEAELETVAVEEPPGTEAPTESSDDPFRGPGDWYVVHTYAGYENKVKANLESRIHTMQMEGKIFRVHIPMEDVMEIKGGKKQIVQKKVFPGYLLVKMDYDNDSWYVVRNTPGVTGFVSAGTGQKPTPLSRREIEKILVVKKEEHKPAVRLGFEEGDVVRITSGPFADFNGTISEINPDQAKLKVLVNIFDRETPVELSFDQVAKV
jgi:transcription termination/antitermination protein NusG